MSKKTLVLEFCGMPNSGKSTLSKKIKRYLNQKGYKCEVLNEGIRNSPITPKGGLEFNLWGLLTLTTTLLKTLSLKPDVVLLDRGPNDLTIYSTVLYKNKLISRSQSNRLKQISILLNYLVTRYVLFLVDPIRSLSRDEKHSKDKNGIVMNPKFLNDLHNSYKSILKPHALIVVDSNKKNIVQLEEELKIKLLKMLKKYI